MAMVLLLGWAGPGRVLGHGPAHERIAALDAEIAREPGNARLLLTRGELWRSDGNATNALADMDRAAAADPGLAPVHFVRGRILLDMDRPAEAAAAFGRYLEHHPDNAAAFLWRARARGGAGDADGAAGDYDAALRIDPLQGPDPYLERARHLRSRGPAHREAALAGLRDGLERLGSLVTLELEAVDLELDLGRPDEALARLERIARRSQRPELWRVRRAEILDGLGRADEARVEWREAAAACARLPERLRRTPALKALEERIVRALGEGIPGVDAPPSDGAARTNTTLRRVPFPSAVP